MIESLEDAAELVAPTRVRVMTYRVAVYFNLHKKTFSIKALTGPRKGLVMGHSDFVNLIDVSFKVNQGGRDRYLREKKKNVHAFIIGTLVDQDTRLSRGENHQTINAVTYNPYKAGHFYAKEMKPERKAINAATALLSTMGGKAIIVCGDLVTEPV